MERLVEIINRWDPIDLMDCSPDDEYMGEIRLIAERINTNTDYEKLANDIKEIFIQSFGESLFDRGSNECVAIAKIILETVEN